jgi:hypothetical protein
MGARVIAVSKDDWVKEFGADYVIGEYGRVVEKIDELTQGKMAYVVLNSLRIQTWENSFASVGLNYPSHIVAESLNKSIIWIHVIWIIPLSYSVPDSIIEVNIIRIYITCIAKYNIHEYSRYFGIIFHKYRTSGLLKPSS